MQQLLGIGSKALERRLAVTEYVFDENNDNFYPKSDEYNEFFIKQVGVRFNDLLRYQGFVFLNDVLKALGIKPRVVGQIVGWTTTRSGFIHIEITQRKVRDGQVVEYSLKIEHEGVIVFDALGD